MANPILGVLLLAVAGLAAGSFYIPFRRVQGWSWESYWIVNGLFSWVIAPWVVCLVAVPDLWSVLSNTPTETLLWCYFYGVLYGIGGLTFGLSMRYLGMSLGYALALGLCAALGTLVVPIHNGQIWRLLATGSGLTTLAGVAVCLGGIAVCGYAGVAKERTMPEDQKKAAIEEFNLVKGFWVAVVAGILSACMSFGITAGGPIKDLAKELGSSELWKGTPTLIVVLAGAFTTNLIWCARLNFKNGSARDYFNLKKISLPVLLGNYLFSAMAGILWYMQFMFYTMGDTQMGKYGFASWSLLMAFVIVFSNVWGLAFHEWRGVGRRVLNLILGGIAILILSTIIIGFGSYLKQKEEKQSQETPSSATVISKFGGQTRWQLT